MNNIFDAIPDNLDTELVEQLLQHNTVKIERIVSKGHRSPESGWYDQDNNEWVMVLKGEAILSFEAQSPVRLKSGDYINIPAHTKHQVKWTDPETETVWLALHY